MFNSPHKNYLLKLICIFDLFLGMLMCSVSEKRCACQSGAESGVAVQDTGQSSSSAVGHSPIITLFHNYYRIITPFLL